MPAFTVTFDHTTDRLTIPGHGQTNGAGPAVLRNVGGAVPAALATLTEYWLKVIDANTVQLATSSANALAGVVVAFADNGTGTTYLEIGLPYVRQTTLVPNVGGPGAPTPGSQVPSALLNNLQDALKALHRFVTGQAQTVWSSIVLAANQDISISGTASYKRGSKVRHIAVSSGRQWDGGTPMINDVTQDRVSTTAATNVYRIPIVLNEGERLQRVKCRANDAGSDVLTMKVYKTDWSGAAARTQLGATANSAGSTGADETLDSGAIAEVVGGATFCTYFAEFTCTYSAGCNFGGLDVTTDVP